MSNKTVYPYGTTGQLPTSIGLVNDFVTGGADKALTAEAGKQLHIRLYGDSIITANKSDMDIYRVRDGVVTTTNPTRIRCIIPITAGDKVFASSPWGKGVTASIYETESDCLYAGLNYLQTFQYECGEYSISGTATKSGYLVVSMAREDNGIIDSNTYNLYIAAFRFYMGERLEEGDIVRIERELGKDAQKLFLGTLVQKGLTASGLSNSSVRVSTASNMVVPHETATLYFKLPFGYAVGIRSGDQSGNLSNNNYWFYDGDTFTFAPGVHYFRLCFAHVRDEGNYRDITVSEVNDMLNEGEIVISLDSEANIIERNYENEKVVKGVMRNFVLGASNNGGLTKLPVFAHTSDVHGDATRFQSFMEYCDYLGVDAALVSGDTVASTPVDAMQYINDLSEGYSTPILLCMGNHDSRGLSSVQEQNEQIMGYLITKHSCITNSNETYPTYFYKDITSKSIRIISLNIYEGAHTSSNVDKCIFSQVQCEWFISTLTSTPSNYGVLVMFHSPESMPTKDNSHSIFYQDIVNYSGLQNGLTGDPFREIIDAFIGRTSTSITYTSSGTSITVSADFTSVASGVEFIAYVNGHLHVDRVGYISDASHLQLNLNVCCGVAIYGSTYQYLANNSDLPRGCVGSTQDCFNIYTIDRTKKTVRIAKVGSNITGDLTERKYMEIPYAE